MFENMAIVQSAVSSFNNAALLTPAFLWVAVLCLPLYLGGWMCRDVIIERMGWKSAGVARTRAVGIFMILTLGWIILMGGNYSVLRDAMSTLPWVVAVMMFGAAIGLGGTIREHHSMFSGTRHRRMIGLGLFACLIMAAAISGLPNIWGAIMNAAAVLGGIIVGRRAPRLASSTMLTLGLVILGTILLLMQPEYFRFGQLGNLTLVHLLGVAVTGALATGTAVLHLVRPRAWIYPSAYIKLKWMMRVVVALGVALFVLTESVPVFLGLCAAFGALCALGVIHAERLPGNLAGYALGATMMAFGTLTMMPAVGLGGLIYIATLPRGRVLGALRSVL